jgi:hypothetical protein
MQSLRLLQELNSNGAGAAVTKRMIDGEEGNTVLKKVIDCTYIFLEFRLSNQCPSFPKHQCKITSNASGGREFGAGEGRGKNGSCELF